MCILVLTKKNTRHTNPIRISINKKLEQFGVIKRRLTVEQLSIDED